MLGRGLLFAAMGFAAFASLAAPLSLGAGSGGRVVRHDLYASARRALVACAVCIGASAGVLWYAFFTRDFQIAYVAEHTSRAAQPWYTFSALWAGMSGSLLLWCLVLAVFAAVFATRRDPATAPFVPWGIPTLGAGLLFFLGITAGPENPFRTLDLAPADGRGLNPLLQSPGMVIHPPLLYVGLVGLSVPFAIAAAALITNRTGADWIRVVRRWMLVPWLALGFGLMLGGAWAYTELGWGGYWAWDPVENAALLPWLAATAFLHSAIVQERRGMLKGWNFFLVVTSAALATFGTFLTRSGLLSSVHTFAESPIGRWFFVFLALQTIFGLSLIAWRLPQLRAENRLDSPISKEAGFLFNNLMIVGMVAIVLWGTLLPLASEAVTGRQITLGPPFFNRVMAPLGALLLVLASVGSVLPWRRGSLKAVASRLGLPAAAATLGAGAALAATTRGLFAAVVWVAVLLVAVSVSETIRGLRARRAASASWGRALTGLVGRNPRRYGGYLVHVGIAVMVLGFAGSFFRTQTEVTLPVGEGFSFAGYRIDYRELQRFRTPDKDVNLAVLDVHRGGRHVQTLRPQLNLHREWDQPASEIAIRTTPAADLYVILAGTRGSEDDAVFLVHHNPAVFWVWVGTGLATLGGLVALLAGGRRRRDAPIPAPGRRPEGAAWTR